MITNGVRCFEDRERARAITTRDPGAYLYSLVCLYHDTFPKPEGVPTWPEPPLRMLPEFLDDAIAIGAVLCGTPEEVCEQLVVYEQTGVDQLVFGFPNDLSVEESLECLETFGQRVIPEFDRDPTPSTDRYRATARPKFTAYAAEPPPIESVFTQPPAR
jgi:hypothetical protein